MDFSFITQADQAAFELERAKRALELAKSNLETAKQAYDAIMAQAENNGIPRARLKKLVDERVQALLDGGLADAGAGARLLPKSERGAKKPKKTPVAEPEVPLRPVPDIWNGSEPGAEAESDATAPSNA